MPTQHPKTEDDLRAILLANPLTMPVLRAVQACNLPDWAVGAGFVRNQIWDYMCGLPLTQSFSDIDVLYFDNNDMPPDTEKKISEKLHAQFNQFEWEVVNQARTHLWKEHEPYADTAEAIKNWTETATAVAVRLTATDTIEFITPWGLDDMYNLTVRATDHGRVVANDYRRRIEEKGWRKRWSRLTVIGI